MAFKPKFSGSITTEETKAETKTKDAPQAYIFIGRDKYRTNDDRTAQDWRKLFVCLSRMARDDDGKEVSQNEFGLGIVYDALEVMESEAKKALKDKYDAAMAKHWADALEEDRVRAEKQAARLAEKNKKDEDDVEQALTASVKKGSKK